MPQLPLPPSLIAALIASQQEEEERGGISVRDEAMRNQFLRQQDPGVGARIGDPYQRNVQDPGMAVRQLPAEQLPPSADPSQFLQQGPAGEIRDRRKNLHRGAEQVLENLARKAQQLSQDQMSKKALEAKSRGEVEYQIAIRKATGDWDSPTDLAPGAPTYDIGGGPAGTGGYRPSPGDEAMRRKYEAQIQELMKGFDRTKEAIRRGRRRPGGEGKPSYLDSLQQEMERHFRRR